jgi:hypothetical protein
LELSKDKEFLNFISKGKIIFKNDKNINDVNNQLRERTIKANDYINIKHYDIIISLHIIFIETFSKVHFNLLNVLFILVFIRGLKATLKIIIIIVIIITPFVLDLKNY